MLGVGRWMTFESLISLLWWSRIIVVVEIVVAGFVRFWFVAFMMWFGRLHFWTITKKINDYPLGLRYYLHPCQNGFRNCPNPCNWPISKGNRILVWASINRTPNTTMTISGKLTDWSVLIRDCYSNYCCYFHYLHLQISLVYYHPPYHQPTPN